MWATLGSVDIQVKVGSLVRKQKTDVGKQAMFARPSEELNPELLLGKELSLFRKIQQVLWGGRYDP